MTSFGARQVVEQEPDSEHKFLQIYFIDNYESQVTARCNITANLNRDLVRSLQDLLHAHNHYIQSFKAALETLPQNHADYRVIIHSDKLPPEEHERRYNAPMTNEVALLMILKLAEFLLKMILGKNAQNVQKITDLIKENPRTTLLELEQDTGISKTTIGRIVTKDLKLKKTPAKFIPRFLTNEQKLCRLATCENMLEMTRTDPEWKDKIITGDETWVYDSDPETKRQYAEWRGQDIAPNYFFLFPKLKAVLKGRHFDTRDDIIEKSLLALKSIPKELYKNCFDNLGKRWRCGDDGGTTVDNGSGVNIAAMTEELLSTMDPHSGDDGGTTVDNGPGVSIAAMTEELLSTMDPHSGDDGGTTVDNGPGVNIAAMMEELLSTMDPVLA
ncbi:hypothetical protein LAZ67_6002663 [Cordylochernes scorpioides]|uniref:Uncharacterized protein n=1 Tax=Cordylochernes scorpioides TaxID=51811 RepID=A0ABY6KK00_9ARAC|nr:hypothetical protein LAZ67_6002663 [Cordylochernes scorpioides]